MNAIKTYNYDEDILKGYFEEFEAESSSFLRVLSGKFKGVSVEDINDLMSTLKIAIIEGRAKIKVDSYENFKACIYIKLNSMIIDYLRKDSKLAISSLDDSTLGLRNIKDSFFSYNRDPFEFISETYEAIEEEDLKGMLYTRAKELLSKKEFEMYSWMMTHTIIGLRAPKQVDYANAVGITRKTACLRYKNYINKLSEDDLFKAILTATVSCQRGQEHLSADELKELVEKGGLV